jgi:hypothetical protein
LWALGSVHLFFLWVGRLLAYWLWLFEQMPFYSCTLRGHKSTTPPVWALQRSHLDAPTQKFLHLAYFMRTRSPSSNREKSRGLLWSGVLFVTCEDTLIPLVHPLF